MLVLFRWLGYEGEVDWSAFSARWGVLGPRAMWRDVELEQLRLWSGFAWKIKATIAFVFAGGIWSVP